MASKTTTDARTSPDGVFSAGAMAVQADELRCELCGLREDRSESAYCRKCGARLTAVRPSEPPAESRASASESAPSTEPDGLPPMERPFGTTTRGLGSPREVAAKDEPPPAVREPKNNGAEPEFGAITRKHAPDPSAKSDADEGAPPKSEVAKSNAASKDEVAKSEAAPATHEDADPEAASRPERPGVAKTADDFPELPDAVRAVDTTGPPKPSDRLPRSKQPSEKKPPQRKHRDAPPKAVAAVGRVLGTRVGASPATEMALTAARAVGALLIAIALAAAVVEARDRWGRGLADALSTDTSSPALDALFGAAFIAVGLATTRLLFGLTARGWKRPRWGRS
jgi:hypothetical protein